MQNEFLREQEVCARFSISPATLRRRIVDGVLPAPCFLGQVMRLWPRGEIEAAEQRIKNVRSASGLAGNAALKKAAAKPKSAAQPAAPSTPIPRTGRGRPAAQARLRAVRIGGAS